MQLQSLILAAAAVPCALAASWGYGDALVTISPKGLGKGVREMIPDKTPLDKQLSFSQDEVLELALTAKEGGTPKKPHQAFLQLKDSRGLSISYPLVIKGPGKAQLKLKHENLPLQFLHEGYALDANILLASFGESRGLSSKLFSLVVLRASEPARPQPVRYGKLPEIAHTFKAGPKTPHLVVSLLFVTLIIATGPNAVGMLLYLGANLSHLPIALKSAPVAHIIFLASIVAIEFTFFLYYSTWNLFQMLPLALGLGGITVVSGSRALSEVQQRRLAGLR